MCHVSCLRDANIARGTQSSNTLQQLQHTATHYNTHTAYPHMGRLRSVRSIKSEVYLQNVVYFIGLFCKRDL